NRFARTEGSPLCAASSRCAPLRGAPPNSAARFNNAVSPSWNPALRASRALRSTPGSVTPCLSVVNLRGRDPSVTSESFLRALRALRSRRWTSLSVFVRCTAARLRHVLLLDTIDVEFRRAGDDLVERLVEIERLRFRKTRVVDARDHE